MDRWINGWVYGWMDNWLNKLIRIVLCFFSVRNSQMKKSKLSVSPGMLCAAYYPIDQLWHRALVEGINETEKVTIIHTNSTQCSCQCTLG